MKSLEINFLGTRGSIPVNSKEYEIFGGATVCVLIKSENSNLLLDAGSGLIEIEEYINVDEDTVLDILISHTHLDHIMGILVSRVMFNPKITINIYGVTRNNLSIKEQINKMMCAPIWPVDSNAFTANVNFIDIKKEVQIGKFDIKITEGNHAGGSSLFKITYNNKTIIYATDFELDDNSMQTLVDFSKNADLLICDGQYSDDNKMEKIGFGHSSWQDVLIASRMANCKQVCIFHHDPYSSDEYLLGIENTLKNKSNTCFLARKGGRVYL